MCKQNDIGTQQKTFIGLETRRQVFCFFIALLVCECERLKFSERRFGLFFLFVLH